MKARIQYFANRQCRAILTSMSEIADGRSLSTLTRQTVWATPYTYTYQKIVEMAQCCRFVKKKATIILT